MRIHSDVLTSTDLHTALRTARAARAEHPIGADVFVARCSRHGSRKRDHALEVRLLADGRQIPAAVAEDLRVATGRNYRTRRLPNSGAYGADHGVYAPTWCEYGWWMAALYAIDPEAIIGQYAGRADFDAATNSYFA